MGMEMGPAASSLLMTFSDRGSRGLSTKWLTAGKRSDKVLPFTPVARDLPAGGFWHPSMSEGDWERKCACLINAPFSFCAS